MFGCGGGILGWSRRRNRSVHAHEERPGLIRQNWRSEGAPKIPRILLPFPKPDALESAASGKMDNIIEAKELQIERKHFYVELRENDRGRFLRITEEAHGRRNSIIVPSTGVDDFTATIAEVLTNNDGAPA
jgi:PurA ssDNA and RNA-binding protein